MKQSKTARRNSKEPLVKPATHSDPKTRGNDESGRFDFLDQMMDTESSSNTGAPMPGTSKTALGTPNLDSVE